MSRFSGFVGRVRGVPEATRGSVRGKQSSKRRREAVEAGMKETRVWYRPVEALDEQRGVSRHLGMTWTARVES